MITDPLESAFHVMGSKLELLRLRQFVISYHHDVFTTTKLLLSNRFRDFWHPRRAAATYLFAFTVAHCHIC